MNDPRKPPGCVSADTLYTLAEIRDRLRLGPQAMREARRAGLVVRRIGRRGYVLGRDLIRFLDARDERQEGSND